MNESSGRFRVRFGAFVLDRQEGALYRDGVRLKLTGIPIQVLEVLTERPDALISRAELRERIWSDGTHVNFDANLNNAVNRLRDALGDAAERPRFIETLPRKGYRFVATVSPDEVETAAGGAASFAPWIRGLAGPALVALVLGVTWLGLRSEAPPTGDRLTLVVLPFRNLGPSEQGHHISGYLFAMHHAVLGETDEALAALERAEEERDGMLVYVKVDPVFDDLRERPRFRALVERMKFPG